MASTDPAPAYDVLLVHCPHRGHVDDTLHAIASARVASYTTLWITTTPSLWVDALHTRLIASDEWLLVNCHWHDVRITVLYQRAYTMLYNANSHRIEKYTWYVSDHSVQTWLRTEWHNRAKLPFTKANDACGVKEAAARKYMRYDKQRYFPPPDMMLKMATYANEHGATSAVPYFSLDGQRPLTSEEWGKQRFTWVNIHDISNVWPDFSISRVTYAVAASSVWTYPAGETIPTLVARETGETKERDDPMGQEGKWSLARGDVHEAYELWPAPDLILCDGPNGLGKYKGEPETVDGLPGFYEAHARIWASRAKATTRLCFWSSERAWATVHPTLRNHGWILERIVLWDKGLAHVEKNWNSKNARMFPIVTEVCGIYRHRRPMSDRPGPSPGPVAMDRWQYPSVRGVTRTTHPNQKPDVCMKRLVCAYTQHGDVVWEPFGGSATGAVVASDLGRSAYVAERIEQYADLAEARLKGEPLPKQPRRRKAQNPKKKRITKRKRDE